MVKLQSTTPLQFKLQQIEILRAKIRVSRDLNPRLASAYKKELKKLTEQIQ